MQMKSAIQWIAMIACCTYAIMAHAHCGDCAGVEVETLEEKFYIYPAQICLAESGIYIATDGMLYETPAIHADENGYYITQLAKQSSCSWYEWKCSKCHRCNTKGIDWKCKKCKKPIEEC